MKNLSVKIEETSKKFGGNMKNYYLYLDESGKFQESVNTGLSSIVAGFLSQNWNCTDTRAENLLTQVKANNQNFSTINISPFHAMEDTSIHIFQFIVELMERMAERNVQFVIFKSQKNYNIVNSDVTYLNVFAEGLVNLVQRLLAQTNEEITLNVVYASRLNMKAENEIIGSHIRIEENEYTERIEERIAWRMARLNLSIRNKIQINLSVGNARKLKSLMLADAVCYAMRGGKKKFDAEQRQRIKNLPTYSFSLLDQISWSSIQNALIENRLAEAIYSVFGFGMPELLDDYREIFFELLTNKLKEIGNIGRKFQYDSISQILHNLVENREYDAANYFIDALDKKFFPLLEKQKFEFEEFYFDVHFYKLTVATHQGNTLAEQNEIYLCRKFLPYLPSTCETLDYYLKYKLREVEHLINIYDFETALNELDKLEKTLTDMVELVQMLDGLGKFGQDIRSTTLGKVIGSRTMVKIYLSYKNPQYIESARKDSDIAIENFTNPNDKARQYQLRSMLETVAGNFSESLKWLGKAFNVEDKLTPAKVLNAIINFQGLNIFGFLHFVNLMAATMTANDPLAKKMYDAWINQNAESILPKDMHYPMTLIYRQIGKCRALQGNKNAINYYDSAIKNSMCNLTNLTHYAMGIIMEIERFLIFYTERDIKQLNRIILDYKKFIESDIPESMKKSFVDWNIFEQKITPKDSEKIREYFFKTINKIPLI